MQVFQVAGKPNVFVREGEGEVACLHVRVSVVTSSHYQASGFPLLPAL